MRRSIAPRSQKKARPTHFSHLARCGTRMRKSPTEALQPRSLRKTPDAPCVAFCTNLGGKVKFTYTGPHKAYCFFHDFGSNPCCVPNSSISNLSLTARSLSTKPSTATNEHPSPHPSEDVQPARLSREGEMAARIRLLRRMWGAKEATSGPPRLYVRPDTNCFCSSLDGEPAVRKQRYGDGSTSNMPESPVKPLR